MRSGKEFSPGASPTSPQEARPRRLGRKGKLRPRPPQLALGRKAGPAAPARAEAGQTPSSCLSVPAFPVCSAARGQHRAGTSLPLPLSPAPPGR